MTVKKARPTAKKLTQPKAPTKKSPVKRLKLKNGLSVLLIENHKSPVVSVQMWVKTGSADEKKGEEGISHFIEHLVFKGTDHFGVGEIASTVEASGGELNAYTSFDQTVFYVNISREFSDVALDVIAQMMGFPKFEAVEIDNEREVVIEEIKRSNDSPGRQASRLLFSTVFKSHPYGIPVIGYDSLIKKVSRKVLVNYYQSRYVPKNMQLIVAGDFENADMAKKITEMYGAVQTFKLRPVSRKKEAAQTQPRIKVEKTAFEEAQFHLAWRVPGATHKDIPALDVLAMVLGQGDTSRLSTKLRLEKALTNSIGAGTFTPKDVGIFTVSGSLNIAQFPEVLSTLKAELLRMVREAPAPEELSRAVVNLESDEFYGMETIEGVARKAGSFENLMGDYGYFKKFLKQIYALTPEDLNRVARKYLSPKAMSFVTLVPREEKEIEKSVKAWIATYKTEFAQASKAKVVKTKKMAHKKVQWAMGEDSTPGAIERHKLSTGGTILFRTDHATPVFSAKAAFLGGIRAEAPDQTGLTELLSRTWTSGTRSMSEADISRRIENIAGGLSAFGGRNSTGLSMQSISPFEDEAISLFEEVLTEPKIDNEIVEREKSVMIEAIRSRDDNPGQLVSQLFMTSMFKEHPYARDSYGTKESVQKLKASDVTQQLKTVSMGQNLMISVCGNVDRQKWIDELEKATARFPKGKALTTQFPAPVISKTEKVYKKLEREQSHIMIGYHGLTLKDPRRYALQVMQSILAGQGGRLFLELRDKASLAYSVSPMNFGGLETGYFGAYIGCSPEKGKKAIEMLQIEFQKLIDQKAPDSEIERAKRYLIGRHDIDLQRNSAISSSLLFNEIYGIPAEETFQYADHLRDITANDVQKLAAAIFTQPYILAAVGPIEPF